MKKEKIIDCLPATRLEENLMSAFLSLFILGVLGDVMALGSQLEIVNDNIFTDEQNTLVDHFSMIAELLVSYSFMAMIAVFARVAHRLGRTVSGWTIVSYVSWICVVFGAIYLTDVKPLELFSEADYSGEAFYILYKLENHRESVPLGGSNRLFVPHCTPNNAYRRQTLPSDNQSDMDVISPCLGGYRFVSNLPYGA